MNVDDLDPQWRQEVEDALLPGAVVARVLVGVGAIGVLGLVGGFAAWLAGGPVPPNRMMIPVLGLTLVSVILIMSWRAYGHSAVEVSDAGVLVTGAGERAVPWERVDGVRVEPGFPGRRIVVDVFGEAPLAIPGSALLSAARRDRIVAMIDERRVEARRAARRRAIAADRRLEPRASAASPDPDDPEPYFDEYTRGGVDDGDAWPSYRPRRPPR